MAKTPFVLGYYADWTSLSPAQIDYSLFTHLSHSFATVNATGALSLPALSKSRDLCKRAKAKNVKVLLAVGGASSARGMATATATPAKAAGFADALVAAAMAAGYNGLDMDWEFPENADEQTRMNALVRLLRERLPQGATLTMAVPATDWSGKWFNTNALLPYVDLLNVMTYDFHGPWTDHAGHNANLFAAKEDTACRTITVGAAVNYWLKTKAWPREKLLVGIPLYGRGFRAARIGDKAAKEGGYARAEVPFNAIAPLVKAGWKRAWDQDAQVPVLHDPAHTEVLSYEDAESARIKGRFVRTQGFGGVMFWEISQDYNGKTNTLVRAVRDGLAR